MPHSTVICENLYSTYVILLKDVHSLNKSVWWISHESASVQTGGLIRKETQASVEKGYEHCSV